MMAPVLVIPAPVMSFAASPPTIFEIPKSTTLTIVDPSSRRWRNRFSGFRSR
jgi:hypothetical protein